MRRRQRTGIGILLVTGMGVLTPLLANAQPIPPGTQTIEENISITRHNLSSAGLGDVKSNTESEVCVFCHTPHGANNQVGIGQPIWNRNLSQGSGYVLYDQTWSFSFEGQIDPSPGNRPTGYSRLCLTCHDGTIALGSVINKPGSGGFQGYVPTTDVLSVQNTGPSGTMPGGSLNMTASPTGALTGDTRLLGANLQNDHAISFVFDSNLAVNIDAELVDPGPPPATLNMTTPLAPDGGHKTGVKRYPGNDPLAGFTQVQCTSCHNPHAVTYPKFLRAPRLQDATETGYLPAGGPPVIAPAGQIICLYCHSKPGWDQSTHDVSGAIRSAYPAADDPGTLHPENYDFNGINTVGQVACRNCHDPHTAQGAKRLHREGVTAFGSSDAIENTCYLCHSPNTAANPLLPAGDPTSGGNPRFASNGQRIAPDIYTDFSRDSSSCTGGVGTGSAMCLQLATGHEPVFISRSQEGVQMKSEGVALTPVQNEETPGITQLDVTHIECTDCHNPHQVNSPNSASTAYNGAPNSNPPNANGEGARFKGMKGIGIDISGVRPVVVGRCEPGFVICGTDTTINGTSANRDPYVYEICFRCHGNSVEKVFGPESGTTNLRFPEDVTTLTVPTGYTSYTQIVFSPRTDPTNGATGNAFSSRGFSNKWKELNPETDDVESPAMLSIDLARFGQIISSHTQQTKNPAYHPVVKAGRNRSPQLCKQLSKAFGLTSCDTTGINVLPSAATALSVLDNLTIQCTDCHNSSNYDAYSNVYSDTYNAAVDESGLRGPLTESNLRPTDIWPDLNNVSGFAYVADRPTKPIGPHGSAHRRLLRANYDTDILRPGRCFEQGNPTGCANGDGYSSGQTHGIAGGGAGSNNSHYTKFLLCFQCHDRRAFDPDAAASGGSNDQDRSMTRFFGLNTSTGADSWWNGNLHMYHLRWSGAMCHECHYNVHSNVEGINTIFGDGKGGLLPPDGVEDGNAPDGVVGTHLINFAPTVEGTTAIKPMWWYDGTSFRCYLRCHNEVMDSCAYQAPSSGTPNARWCAGGRNPGTSG